MHLSLSHSTSVSYGDLWRLSGTPSTEQSVGCDNVWFAYTHLHGLLNGVAFGLLFPIGFIVARFHRCRRSKAWFIIHVCIQVSFGCMVLSYRWIP